MPRSAASRSRRTLATLVALVALLAGGLAAAVQYSTARWTPLLALDLRGGSRIVLEAQVDPSEGEVTEQTIADAIAIIRQRVDSSGVAEAEVTSEGERNIVVSLPGRPEEQADERALIRQSAQMRFRPVLAEVPADAALPDAGTTPAPEGTLSPQDGGTPAPSEPAPSGDAPSGDATSAPSPGADEDPALELMAAEPTPAEAATTEPAPAGGAPAPEPTDASDLAQVTPELVAQLQALDCTDPVAVGTALDDDPDAPVATCSADGAFKYLLGPVEVEGTDIAGATAGLGTTTQGAPTNEWGVNLELDDGGADAFADSSTRLFTLEPPRNQFAIVLDGQVISAPRINSPITNGDARIDGNFTEASARTLANQLEFGALPISFEEQTVETTTATLGAEQLQNGLLAGAIGLALVVVYSLLTYRLLGFVTIGSLAVAGVITYLVIGLLGWYQGYRLSLAGIAGFIMGIGVTADSFILFFERVRDELREGRPLRSAVETGWLRARRTIYISGFVSLLAAVVLYVLAVGSVRGFAFTLGLTTIIDVLVAVLFTHPVVVLLARSRFFASGHSLSGLDPLHSGRAVYAGRGRIRPAVQGSRRSTAPAPDPQEPVDPAGDRLAAVATAPVEDRRMTIAERKAAERAAARAASSAEDGPTGGVTTSGAGGRGREG